MRPRVLGTKERLGDGVVADEKDEAPGRERDAEVARAPRPRVWLRRKCDSRSLRENAFRVVRRSVVDDDDLERRRVFLTLEGVEHALQHRHAVVRGDDDRVLHYTRASDAAIDLKTPKPSALPSSASEQRSGCGIMPRTLRSRLQMPAMLRADPFGFDADVIRPSPSQ